SWEGGRLGSGRPGWHIECVAIALDHLGMGFDVQGGGSDLAFPHHEMGASHAQALTGEYPFARAYVHAGMVGLDGEKMSKSKGNLVFVSALRRDGVDPAAIRLALLAHHYRSDWEWTDQVLADAVERLARWRAAVSRPDGLSADALVDEVRAALADDLDSPAALAAVDRWAARQTSGGGTDEGAPGLVSRTVDALLGVAL
ncbi:class I tRNA ligase family protein, partial [Streptomyces sp. NRRL WC-3549]|uniref:class I tRNA ligase family protein n=1 Tax=Streptomyces sp. NRRL WC-3549 TaxID=1463925 RepID=UPI0004CB01F0